MSWQEPWQASFRHALAPQFTDAGLAELRRLLAADDPRLTQRQTVAWAPAPVAGQAVNVGEARVTGGCPVVVAGGCLGRPVTVDEALAHFRAVCEQAPRVAAAGPWWRRLWWRLVGPAAWRRSGAFLAWWDETPRAEARGRLLALVEEIRAARRPWARAGRGF